jgi:hypothetical protein
LVIFSKVDIDLIENQKIKKSKDQKINEKSTFLGPVGSKIKIFSKFKK